MPKLSKQTLDKMFSCPYCEKKIRSRQGLSGHIQFKHGWGILNKEEKQTEAPISITDFIINAKVAGFNTQEIKELKKMMLFWEFIVPSLKEANINFDNIDYKHYLIVSLAIIQANKAQSQFVVDEIIAGIAPFFSIIGENTQLLGKLIQLNSQ